MKNSVLTIFVISMLLLCGTHTLLAQPTDGLVAYYPFNGDANDESGNGLNGVLYGPTLVADRFGNPNASYEFDGFNDRITIPTASGFNFLHNGSNFTISCWLKTNINAGAQIIFSNTPGGDRNGIGLYIQELNGLKNYYFYIGRNAYGGPPTWAVIIVTWPVVYPSNNEWTHVLITYDYNLENNQVKCYENEVLKGTANRRNEHNPGNAYGYLQIGRYVSEYPEYFDGKLDDIRMYNRVLSEAEISELYNEGQTPEEMVENIIDEIEELINTGELDENNASSLIAKLENVIDKIDKNNIIPAINQLEAFINQVNAYVNAEILTEEQGQSLITAAEELIAELMLLGKTSEQLSSANSNMLNEYTLDQCFPNPFNPTTTIKYQIPNDGLVTLKIYDVLGNEVATLVDERKEEGRYQITFDASVLSSGVYIYQIRSGDFIDTKKMILMK